MTKYGKSKEKEVGGWKMAVLYWDENDPPTELGKSKEKKVWILKKREELSLDTGRCPSGGVGGSAGSESWDESSG